mmetsp:Transcript_141833/g.453174  ORF Transcript_141833/g.453174 Transcript_141833/m.453174 type:complete len:303 (+) Transcript_141833:557-1465(+)
MLFRCTRRSPKRALLFFWQGPGGISPYLLGLLLMDLPKFGDAIDTSVQFRTLLGVGAIPALVVLLATSQEEDDTHPIERKEGQLAVALQSPAHWRTLIGTAGTWFFFDVAYYGTVIFSPTILSSVFGAQESLRDVATRAAALCCLGMLGTALGLLVFLPMIGAKALNTVGLALASLLFGLFAVVYHLHPHQSSLLFSCLCLLIFTLQIGPNVATFLLPVVAFPEEVRSTFHGLSAAAAKLGAMTGALLFPIVNERYGVPAVMAAQAGVCAVGALLSHCAVREVDIAGENEDSDDEPLFGFKH